MPSSPFDPGFIYIPSDVSMQADPSFEVLHSDPSLELLPGSPSRTRTDSISNAAAAAMANLQLESPPQKRASEESSGSLGKKQKQPAKAPQYIEISD